MLVLADVFQSGMILQREKEICIWGNAGPGELINVSIQGKSESSYAQWRYSGREQFGRILYGLLLLQQWECTE